MNLNLKNKRVLVTGSSRGLGLEIVRAFLSEGAVVTMCSRSSAKLQEARDLLDAPDDRLFTLKVDVSQKSDVTEKFKEAIYNMGSLDILINNVGGVNRFASFFDLEEEDWITTYKNNVLSIVNTVSVCCEYLQNSTNARVINISSLTGIQPGIFSPHYSTSKAAVINLNKHLANVLVKNNILVNCIIAGTFESDAWQDNISRVSKESGITQGVAESQELALACDSIPIGRIGNPADITPFILLLASGHSSWTTGASFVIDGGKMRAMN